MLFGQSWIWFVLPAMLGVAVMLIVLALKPSRWVGRAAIGFALVSVLIGVGQLLDAQRDRERSVAYSKCIRAANGGKAAVACGDLLEGVKMGFVGNEAYELNGK